MTILKSGIYQIVLPSPELNDTHGLDMGLVVKRAYDGGRITYIRTPVIATLNLQFAHINRVKAEEMYQFLKNTKGKEIEMIDHQGYIWRGYIPTPIHKFTHTARRNNTFTIEFEGHVYGEAA
jgi:hypothetical protein